METPLLDVDTSREPLLDTWQRVVPLDLNRDNPRRHVRVSFVAG